MLTRDEIKAYFQLENSHAKKELGQNFLCNQKTVDEIVSLVNITDQIIINYIRRRGLYLCLKDTKASF